MEPEKGIEPPTQAAAGDVLTLGRQCDGLNIEGGPDNSHAPGAHGLKYTPKMSVIY